MGAAPGMNPYPAAGGGYPMGGQPAPVGFQTGG